MAKQNLGMVTAYAYAVAGGYTGTEAEFEALLGNIATDLEEIENLTVTATTLPEGSSATASYSDGVLTLGIPKGDTGATGAGATVTAGTTTTGEPGTDASVVNSGTTKDAVFDFTIPRGDTGNGIESITLTSTVGAVHTYTITFTDGDTTTFDVTDGEVTTASLTAILADYAKTDGAYESMTVGNAEQLISSVYVTDEEPYQFRTSGGSIDIGDREFDTLVGGSVAWNQLVNGDNGFGVYDATITQYDQLKNEFTVTLTTSGGGRGLYCTSSDITHIPIGHVCAVLFEAKGSATFNIRCYLNGDSSGYTLGITTTYKQYGRIVKTTAQNELDFYAKDYSANDIFYAKNILVVDLTQLFGSTIADYIYSLEQGQAGAGVAFFRKYFPKPYYAYDAGTIKSVEGVSAHKTVGFNQWDEEWELGTLDNSGNDYASTTRIRSKGYTSVLPSTTYYLKSSMSTQLFYYDADKAFISAQFKTDATFTTPSNAYYLRFAFNSSYGTTYNNDICINLHWDGERDGEYEPYVEHSYPLDDSLTLRGIPKIANGKLYYDGDTYESDGTVNRRFGIVDLGSLTWGYAHSTRLFSTTLSDIIPTTTAEPHIINPIYNYAPLGGSGNDPDMTIFQYQKTIYITNFAYTSISSFTSAMSGVYLVYELATPTTEQAEPFTNPQIVDDFGTEEYVTTSIVPVGHSTKYTNNLKAKLEMSPESPSGDGLYLVQQSSGQNAYVQYISPVPSTPSTDGTYVLKATVSGGTATLAWVAE